MASANFISVASVAAGLEWFAQWLPMPGADLVRRATVLCSGPRAHVIRRAFLQRNQLGRLIGVRLIDPLSFARELLTRVGQPRTPAWEEVRRLRIHHCFDTGAVRSRLEYFDAEQLRSGRGYADAFARVIVDLEMSGLDATLAQEAASELLALDPVASRRLHDVAAVWATVDGDRGTRRSSAQLLAEATTVLRTAPALANSFGPVAAFLAASPSTALLQFLNAQPECTLVFLDARPLRTGTQRWRAAAETGAGHRAVANPRGTTDVTELYIVQQYLFAPSDVVADPARLRSSGPDGTVDIEEYPSIEDEIEAAAIWVAEQIALALPLESIALVVPALDPHARMLLDRLARAAAGDSRSIPAYVAGGLSFNDSPAGLRIGNLLQALGGGLDAASIIALLASLRIEPDDGGRLRLSPSRAAEIVYGSGIVGGSASNIAGALELRPRLQQRRDMLREALDGLPAVDSGEPEKRRDIYSHQEAEAWLHDVEPRWSAIMALQQLAELIAGDASLRVLWRAIRDFMRTHLVVPPDPVNWPTLLDRRLEPALADPLAGIVSGTAAVSYLNEVIAHTRVPHGRFGEPAVFIGTAASAAGLPFGAVRVLGLAEGILPTTPHDDPIVPDNVRGLVEAALQRRGLQVIISRLEDRVLEDLHAFFRVVGGTRDRLALSAARQWVDRSDREVSGVMLEVAAALARSSGDGDEGDVPTTARLRSAYFREGRAARDFGAKHSMQARALLTHAPIHKDGRWCVPASWCADPTIGLDRLQAITTHAATELTAMDGFVTAAWPAVVAPGLTPERPLSAWALRRLLQCPHRFLLSNILRLDGPPHRPSTDTIQPTAYGLLFHAVAKTFFHVHGAALCAREGSLDEWKLRANLIATEQFETWRTQYPLRGEDSIARERQRLTHQIEQLVKVEWEMAQREYIDAERSFGFPMPMRLSVGGGDIYVTGQIDRIDRLSATALSVRDLKTGRVHDFREEPPNASRDLQIGLYVLALEAEQAGVQVTHASYVHPSAALEPERRFEQSDLSALRDKVRAWLEVARGLLAAGTFPRTPVASDCIECPFQPACGTGAQARSAAQLATTQLSPEVAAFARLKQQESDDADG